MVILLVLQQALGMDSSLSEEDQMMRAIAMSLGQVGDTLLGATSSEQVGTACLHIYTNNYHKQIL